MRKFFLFICMTIFSWAERAQEIVTITGFVKDALSGEVLIGATISDGSGVNGVYSDNNGYFLPKRLSE